MNDEMSLLWVLMSHNIDLSISFKLLYRARHNPVASTIQITPSYIWSIYLYSNAHCQILPITGENTTWMCLGSIVSAESAHSFHKPSPLLWFPINSPSSLLLWTITFALVLISIIIIQPINEPVRLVWIRTQRAHVDTFCISISWHPNTHVLPSQTAPSGDRSGIPTLLFS
jgi:hypothetical protein